MADVGYIAFYVLLYVGIVLLLRSRARSIAGTLWLDGITAAFAAAALGAAVLVELVLENTEGSTSTVVTNLAYPLGDVLLLSAVFGVFSLTGWRPGPRWLLLGLGILSTTAADAIYLFQSCERDVRRRHVGRHPLAHRDAARSPRPPGCRTGRARGSRSKADRSSPYPPSARSSRPASSSTTTSRG